MQKTARLQSASVPVERPTHWLTLVIAGFALAAIPLGALLAQEAAAPFTVSETGQGYTRLQDAVDAIGAGRGTIAIAPGKYGDCAVQEAGDVGYYATKAGAAVFSGGTCEGKAALVLRGRAARVSGLVFENMNVSDFNGAGIRIEKGDLTVAQSWFRDSQQGILSAEDPAGTIAVDTSTFTRLGTCEGSGGCAHSIYIGNYGLLKVARSRFEQGRGGHYVKSRSARVDLAGNSFDDTGGKGTNYMIDLPAGATGRIANNWFVQGRDKDNYSTFIAVAAESRDHPSQGLEIVRNDARIAPGIDRKSTFVGNWSGDRLVLANNELGRNLTDYAAH